LVAENQIERAAEGSPFLGYVALYAHYTLITHLNIHSLIYKKKKKEIKDEGRKHYINKEGNDTDY
jgi:hypothetical protein